MAVNREWAAAFKLFIGKRVDLHLEVFTVGTKNENLNL